MSIKLHISRLYAINVFIIKSNEIIEPLLDKG